MRKTIDVVVETEGRDKGKAFRITEMSAHKAEDWGLRALTVMNRSTADIPDLQSAFGAGFIVVAAYGLRALMSANFDEAKPLLDEMMACVHRIPSPEAYPHLTRALVATDTEEDTEEIATRLWLRDKVLELHTGFSLAAAISTWQAQTAARTSSPRNTRTSRKG